MIYRTFFLLNAIFALALLISGIDQLLDLGWFSWIHFLNLVVPYLVGANLLFFVFWVIFKKRNALLSFFALGFALFVFEPFFKLSGSDADIKEGDFSVLTLNAHDFDGPRWTGKSGYKDKIIGFVNEQNADILCFQEFRYLRENELSQYPYRYLNYTPGVRRTHMLQAIYSKYPIINKGSLDFPESSNNAIFADIVIGMDTVRIYNIHLESLHFRLGSLKREEPQRLYQRLDKSISAQKRQVKLIKEHAENTSNRIIIAGDMNNTQFSKIYRLLKEDLTDTFQEKGSGFGNTYHLRFLPFRIDYIFADPSFEVVAHTNFWEVLSDHLPIMASLRFTEDE